MELLTDSIVFTRGSKEDLDEIIEMCRLWWDESLFYKTYKTPYKPDKKLFESFCDSPLIKDIIVCGREGEGGPLVACYCATAMPYHFNPDIMVASELVWSIHPDYRGLGVAFDLLNKAHKILEEEGVEYASLCVSAEDKYEGVGKFVEEKGGYTLMDRVYYRKVRWS